MKKRTSKLVGFSLCVAGKKIRVLALKKFTRDFLAKGRQYTRWGGNFKARRESSVKRTKCKETKRSHTFSFAVQSLLQSWAAKSKQKGKGMGPRRDSKKQRVSLWYHNNVKRLRIKGWNPETIEHGRGVHLLKRRYKSQGFLDMAEE